MTEDDQTIMHESGGDTTAYVVRRDPSACFVQYNGNDIGRRFRLDTKTAVLGRSRNVQIVVPEKSVSRNHALCTQHGKNIYITDLNSSNGTYVNEEQIQHRHLLQDGDIVRVGKIVLKFFSAGNLEKLFHDRIYRMATMDEITGAYNKKYLTQALESEFEYSRKTDSSLSLICFDIDRFKEINDTHGHLAGDRILAQIADIARRFIRRDDMLCRFGGDEFFIILPGTPIVQAVRIAERIREEIEKTEFTSEERAIRATVSLGVAERDDTMDSASAFIQLTDKNLYAAKHKGRNCIVA